MRRSRKVEKDKGYSAMYQKLKSRALKTTMQM
jgi:hypothetical protein